jgi:hypothetical protein
MLELFSISVILLFLRQVSGLRAASKRKKKSIPNAPTRTRPPPIDRIAAQRARREAARKHSPGGNHPQQADLSPAQGRNSLERDIDDQGSPTRDAADYYMDLDTEESGNEEREEEEEANLRHQGKEQEQVMADVAVSP